MQTELDVARAADDCEYLYDAKLGEYGAIAEAQAQKLSSMRYVYLIMRGFGPSKRGLWSYGGYREAFLKAWADNTDALVKYYCPSISGGKDGIYFRVAKEDLQQWEPDYTICPPQAEVVWVQDGQIVYTHEDFWFDSDTYNDCSDPDTCRCYDCVEKRDSPDFLS